ncbi:MAG: glycosyltransferase family 4 protein [Flavobacterium sp.]|nr:glycosyltransferase family 4 protein [Flavobacterium sp.]
MNKEKILHVITVSFVIKHFFGKQFEYLGKKGTKEYHLACSPSAEFYKLSSELSYIPFGVEVTRDVNPIKDLIAIIKIYRYIKKNQIDKVVGHTPKGGMVAMMSSFLAKVPERIYFRHGIIYETSTGVKKMVLKTIDKLTGLLATKVVCVSYSVREISERDRLNDPKKNLILGLGTCNGIDTQIKFNPNNYSKEDAKIPLGAHDINKDTKIIGYVGRIVKDKGIDELLIAWEIIQKKFTNSKLLLVGPIEDKDSISQYSKNRIAEDPSIIFTDFVTDASAYFSLMDVFILPTYREGFPTVALEASSMEIPVLITQATGCKEAINENETGLFISHDPMDIANKIEFYLQNEAIAKLHGVQGRVFVVENFEQTKIWDSIAFQLNT